MRLRIALVLGVVLLSACTSDGGGAEPQAPTPGEPMRLRVLTYNIEYGGDETTDAVIRQVGADVVGVLESYNRLPEIAANTGYPYYNVSLQLLSKYPIHEPSGANGLYAFIEVRPGEVVAFFNHHLDYVRYGPRLLGKGEPVADVIASEDEVRTSALEEPLKAMVPLIEQGYPVFLTGDFNEPSSLDDPGVPWPVSGVLLEAGFRDTYRDVHPDPLEDPGITHARAGDRIDYLYAAGPSETLDSELIGKQGDEGVDVGFPEWTSDHRAVLSTFQVTPVSMPTMISVDRALADSGDDIVVGYHVPKADQNLIQVVPSGADPSTPGRTLEATGAEGEITLDTSGVPPGGWDAVLVDADGDELARVGFWLRDPRAEVQVSTDEASYSEGEPIEVRWTDGPANRWDWIGIYEASKSDPRLDYYLLWGYTGLHASGTLPPTVEGSMTIGPNSQGSPWPLPPGEYVVHYLLTDRYRSAGSASFQVTG